jgi:hypothetical protein
MRRKEQAEHGPYCSRCCKPLVFDYTPYFDADGGFHAGRYHCCPDGCASVAERWRLAFERAACGWAEYTHKCSRCGTNLMGPPLMENQRALNWRPFPRLEGGRYMLTISESQAALVSNGIKRKQSKLRVLTKQINTDTFWCPGCGPVERAR